MYICIKRIYEEPEASDGVRVLVDRLWPRGLSKERARIDHWLKEVAPTTPLRKWYSHEVEKWPEFQRRYREELLRNREPVEELRKMLKKDSVTLLFAAKDSEHNEAVVIRDFLLTN